MKKNKIFSVLSLALVGIFGLASCAPAQVSPEEAKQAVATMKKAYEAGEVTPAKKLTVTVSSSKSKTQGSNKKQQATSTTASIDLDNHQGYAKVISGDQTLLEFWSYVDGNNFITAAIVGTAKTYSSVPVATDKIGEMFDETFAADFVADYNGVSGVELAEEQLQAATELNETSIKADFGESASFELSSEYRSNMKDNLHIAVAASITGGKIEGQAGINIEEAINVKIDNYILSEITIASTTTSKIGDIASSTEISQSIRVDQSASISNPDLSGFTKGTVNIPNLPL